MQHVIISSLTEWSDAALERIIFDAQRRRPRWIWNGQRHLAPFSKTAAGHRRRAERRFRIALKRSYIQ